MHHRENDGDEEQDRREPEQQSAGAELRKRVQRALPYALAGEHRVDRGLEAGGGSALLCDERVDAAGVLFERGT